MSHYNTSNLIFNGKQFYRKKSILKLFGKKMIIEQDFNAEVSIIKSEFFFCQLRGQQK
jgi:hypothetical protein